MLPRARCSNMLLHVFQRHAARDGRDPDRVRVVFGSLGPRVALGALGGLRGCGRRGCVLRGRTRWLCADLADVHGQCDRIAWLMLESVRWLAFELESLVLFPLELRLPNFFD